MSYENERFNRLTKVWVESGVQNLDDPELDKIFERIKKSDMRTARALLPLFNNRLEKILKDRKIIKYCKYEGRYK